MSQQVLNVNKAQESFTGKDAQMEMVEKYLPSVNPKRLPAIKKFFKGKLILPKKDYLSFRSLNEDELKVVREELLESLKLQVKTILRNSEGDFDDELLDGKLIDRKLLMNKLSAAVDESELSNNLEQLVTTLKSQRGFKDILNTRSALIRIENGIFGTCLGRYKGSYCGRPMSVLRLLSCPKSKTHITCKC